jgi:hypothetical protein
MNSSAAPTEFTSARSPTLAEEVAALSQRLAGLLERLDGESPSLLEAKKFLVAVGASPKETSPILRGAPSPLDRLAHGLGLAPVERDLFVLSGLSEAHEGFASVFRQLHPRGEPRASVGLAAQLFCRSASERALFRRAIELGAAARAGLFVVGPSDLPFFERSLLPARGLWSVLEGVDVWPPGLRPLSVPVVRAGLEGWFEEPEVRRAVAAVAAETASVVVVTARSPQTALYRGVALASEATRGIAAFSWPDATEGANELANELALHCLARKVVPVLRLDRKEPSGEFTVPAFGALRGPVIVCTGIAPLTLPTDRAVVSVSVEGLRPTDRARAWRALLPEIESFAPALAARYSIEPAAVKSVARDLEDLDEAGRTPEALLARVAESVRARSTRSLSAGVELIRARASWQDLVVTPDQRAQLRDAVQRLLLQARVLDEWGLLARKRGARGVRMLFAGPPGTGKSLSAEVLASELGVDLLRVDLSRVVSKWIGETEKNLAQVFDAAEESQTVLLFDEADALFAKRTEVSDARDRYANLETAYLLTRLESFEGLAVLSTNLRHNIDAAFTRRLEFIVDFPEPGILEREALWRAHLPATVSLAADVDVGELAALYPLVGGTIRNAAVAAAFMAAAEGSCITREQIVRAIRREYHKSGKAFPGAPIGMN